MPTKESNPYRPRDKRSRRHHGRKVQIQKIVNSGPLSLTHPIVFKPNRKTETVERSLEAELSPPKPIDILKIRSRVAKTTTTESKAT